MVNHTKTYNFYIRKRNKNNKTSFFFIYTSRHPSSTPKAFSLFFCTFLFCFEKKKKKMLAGIARQSARVALNNGVVGGVGGVRMGSTVTFKIYRWNGEDASQKPYLQVCFCFVLFFCFVSFLSIFFNFWVSYYFLQTFPRTPPPHPLPNIPKNHSPPLPSLPPAPFTPLFSLEI